jgi:histidyl-tRNA synthetase
MGMERLLLMLEAAQSLPPPRRPDVFVVAIGAQAQEAALAGTETLREAHPGLLIQQHLGGGSFRSQMKKADRSGASVALIWGEDEVAAGAVSVKPLRGDDGQRRMAIEELNSALPGLLGAGDARH